MATLNLRFLETFVWAARLKSFTQAADKLNATQPAVSSRIASLEAELGVKLFIREHNSLKLTADGLKALAGAEALLRSSQHFVDEITGAAELSGTVRIGISDTVALTWLGEMIRQSNERFPGLRLEFTSHTSVDLMEFLRTGEIDLALAMGPLVDEGFENIELCTYACRWIASPKLKLSGKPVGIEELARYPILSFPTGSQPYAAISRYFQQFEQRDVTLYPVNSLAMIIRMTIDGIGVATIPPVVALRELARGDLEVFESQQPTPPMRFHAVYRDVPTERIPASVAELAREVAHEYCQASDPDLAWNRASMRLSLSDRTR